MANAAQAATASSRLNLQHLLVQRQREGQRVPGFSGVAGAQVGALTGTYRSPTGFALAATPGRSSQVRLAGEVDGRATLKSTLE